ncbi:hypothetical protein N8368_03220 [Bacteroidia bacterium]|nr:hypothetical protein [Bacteroidia bacterium]MDB9882647.1 hypothetical protein [Bacteroidia bacterium]MDC1395500.1 hypothetical protein [Bacteroidia bacterium]
MKTITKLVAFIENPNTIDLEREKASSELNLLGVPSADIEGLAYAHWQEYFSKHIEEILTERIVVVSHLLNDDTIKECFENSFQEYNQKRAQMSPDSIQKFGFTGF